MPTPYYIGLFIAFGLYVISEVLLWFFPAKKIMKYIPSMIGICISPIIFYIGYSNTIQFSEFIHYLFYSIVIFSFSSIVAIVMSMRKPWKKRRETDGDEKIEEVENPST
ncbi:hypothetical protein QA612_05155 [Evansella sp. AB-P1]|uniref:hypothetical protein n=1 Tax=Evansella sp. AB-P1 TaxID=3037653 RepID=UPI00241D80E4|nr:hypothetical protein [Evansella sp. AB-P1]MDG5786872.1 hypothetical protein [Evansella sp. AB-P1]